MNFWASWIALLLLLCAVRVGATTYMPPSAVPLPFRPGSAEAHPAVLAAIDRLVARALRCGAAEREEPFLVTLLHAPMADPGVLNRRKLAIEARFHALQLPVTVSLDPRVDFVPAEAAAGETLSLTPPFMQTAIVQVGDNYWCWDGEKMLYGPPSASPALLRWLDQLEQGLAESPPRLPRFWKDLTATVRSQHLSLALAQLAYLRHRDGSARAGRAYWWLVQHEARAFPPERRLLWVLHLWEAGSDSDLVELQRQLAIPELPIEQRVGRVPELAFSKLPWPTIERRLLAPGLMQVLATPGVILTTGERALLAAAVFHRSEWGSWPRLLKLAGAMRSCLVADAINAFRGTPDPQKLRSALDSLSSWVSEAAPDLQIRHGECDPSFGLLKLSTGCSGGDEPQPDLGARWLQAGFVLDANTVTQALSAEGLVIDGWKVCRIAAARGKPFSYSARTQ